MATSPGEASWRAPISRSFSTSSRFLESLGSWKFSVLRRQSSEGVFSMRSRVILPVRRSLAIGE